MNKFLKILSNILFGVITVLVILFVIAELVPMFFGLRHPQVAGSKNWMGDLPGELYLNEISIPGTHDSATNFVQLSLIARCQSERIEDQLIAGYRYLDIRLELTDNAGQMILTHGITKCKSSVLPWAANLTLDEVLDQCTGFLKAYPSETILFVVKQESGDATPADFEKALDAYVSDPRYSEFFLNTDSIPTLEEARGRLVLFRRYDDMAGLGSRSGIPIFWEDQGSRDVLSSPLGTEQYPGMNLYVQDRYHYDTTDKWNAFESTLQQFNSISPEDPNAVCINFLSTAGKGSIGIPYHYSKDLNKDLCESELAYGNIGWIIVDYADADIAFKIYNSNF